MHRLVIRDLAPEADYLACDLRHVLDALGARAAAATWVAGDVDGEMFQATGTGGVALEALAESGERVSGTRLSELARDTRQVIWGEFKGFEVGNPEVPWVVVRTVDSSFFEILTNDEDVIVRLQSNFNDVTLDGQRSGD